MNLVTGIVALIVTAFCMDSLLKISVGGFFVQAAIPLLLLIPIWYFVIDKNRSPLSNNRQSKDIFIIALLLFILVQLPMARNSNVYFAMAFYMFVATFQYWAISLIHERVNWTKMALYALILFIVTGFIEYGLKYLFRVEFFVRGLDESYYENKGTLGIRMRGLFLEPNWFGLSMFAWFYLYIRDLDRIGLGNSAIIIFTFLCFYFSDNRTILGISIIILLYYPLSRHLGRLKILMPIALVSFSAFLYVYYSINCGSVVDRTASARLCTSGNIIAIWNQVDIIKKLFGFGFSNWGIYSNEMGFSRSNFLKDQSLTRRDNAEFYVFLFEMGVASIVLFGMDLFVLGRKASKAVDAMFIATIYLSGFFYPLYTFLPYLLPVAVVRAKIFARPTANSDRSGAVAPLSEGVSA